MLNSDPIRVLHVLPSLTCAGGMISVVKNYQLHLDNDRVVFDYLYFSEAPDSIGEQLRSRGSRTWCVPFNRSLITFFKEHAGEFDIVHCHPIFSSQFIGPLARRFGAKRIIAHSHSSRFSDKKISALRNSALSWFVGIGATDFIACSEDARRLLRQYGDRALILHNAIDPAEFRYSEDGRNRVRTGLSINSNDIVFGTVARLAPEKNLGLLIRLAESLKRNSCSFRIVIVGGGPLESDLKEMAVHLQVDDVVIFTGPRTDVSDLYSAFDCFCLPSIFEGLPVSVVEAQASGLPCLISDNITREVEFGKCDYLSVGDLNAWIEAASVFQPSENRVINRSSIREAGYDITVEALKLQHFYKQILGL